MKTVDEILNEAFTPYRDPRSREYKEGVRRALDYVINGVIAVCPYELGTAQADAYFSGFREGNHIYRCLSKKE